MNDLEKFGVQQLEIYELENLNGGNWLRAAAKIIAAAVAFDDWYKNDCNCIDHDMGMPFTA